MPLPEVAIGVLGSIVIVQAVSSLAINHHELTAVDQSLALRLVGINVAVTGFGMFLLLYGLSQEYLKTVDVGLYGEGELIPIAFSEPHTIYVGAIVIVASVFFSCCIVVYMFVLHIAPAPETE